MRALLLAVVLLPLLLVRGQVPPSPEAARPRVLLFSRTTGFRHDAIPVAGSAIARLGHDHGFSVDLTEDPAIFDDTSLGGYAAVVFLLTTGDVLDAGGRAAFERYVRSGGGYVGVHSASDTEYGWSWYGGLVGAYFAGHPAIQPAVVRVEDATHPSTASLPPTWSRTDEWYNFRANPRAAVQVLLTLDERSYAGGSMGADHPIAWYHAYDGGRAWYTALGHTRESYLDADFLAHLLGGIQYAAGLSRPSD
jgi:type 1 glutamine amidotransferase